jgi:SAM-dependent methyltransferase
MFDKTADLYDAIYGTFKDYPGEVERLRTLIDRYKRSPGKALLDVACGTGKHVASLREHYSCEGLDLHPWMGEIFRKTNPGLPFHQGDMVGFDLGKKYDVVVCLFGSIGYARTRERLFAAIGNFARHTVAGGVVAVDPWLTPDQYRPDFLGANFVDLPDLKVARMTTSEVTSDAWILHFQYLVGRRGKIEHFEETHSTGLFTDADYLEAFRAAGLEVVRDEQGLMGRGLYIGYAASSTA